ncbi:hypothetical protein [Aestuariibacter sp. A3R04]|uniref:hypothetical protein n=1 Tax=Aestuariibacter sp. A3R04 TaxID=2841571 RepID=UPI001C09BFAF|nr:hypothetical protein [Aestuariibacter sp. A3R04]MBU3021510.1 hypothetical protein [Aestuariibacter sp. A3R04]
MTEICPDPLSDASPLTLIENNPFLNFKGYKDKPTAKEYRGEYVDIPRATNYYTAFTGSYR